MLKIFLNRNVCWYHIFIDYRSLLEDMSKEVSLLERVSDISGLNIESSVGIDVVSNRDSDRVLKLIEHKYPNTETYTINKIIPTIITVILGLSNSLFDLHIKSTLYVRLLLLNIIEL